MPELLRPWIDQARKRHNTRPPSPGVDVKPGPTGYRLESPHRDLEAWEVQICDAFGTRSYSAMSVFLDHLPQICPMVRDDNGEWSPDELYFNAALAIVNGIRPRNEVEAALATQMVDIHFMQMKAAAQALRASYVDHQTFASAGKLARTFAMQCDAMAKLKGKTGRQHISVRSDRHYHDHRHVHAEAPGGGVKNGGRPHGTTRGRGPAEAPQIGLGSNEAIELEQRPALPGADAGGIAMPAGGDQGPEALPRPRGRARVRGTGG